MPSEIGIRRRKIGQGSVLGACVWYRLPLGGIDRTVSAGGRVEPHKKQTRLRRKDQCHEQDKSQ